MSNGWCCNSYFKEVFRFWNNIIIITINYKSPLIYLWPILYILNIFYIFVFTIV